MQHRQDKINNNHRLDKFNNNHRLEACATSGTGFQPVDPWKSLSSKWHKRNLPHIESPCATYFVTFRNIKGLVLTEQQRQVAFDALKFWDNKRIDLDACVVMNDHVHVAG